MDLQLNIFIRITTLNVKFETVNKQSVTNVCRAYHGLDLFPRHIQMAAEIIYIISLFTYGFVFMYINHVKIKRTE